MLMRQIHTLCPDLAILLYTTELPLEDYVELINVLLRPLDAGGHELLREALLEHVDRVLDDGKVDEGDLEDIDGDIALEDALPVTVLAISSMA
jgi:hypothetical protein